RDARQALYQEHILTAAEQIFADVGYEEAKMVSVATAAGVSLATVYRAFETKWDMYRALHARRTAALDEHLRSRTAGVKAPLELMLGGIAAYIEFHMQNPNYLRMHLRSGAAWAMGNLLPSPEQVAAWTEGVSHMTRIFDAGIRAGIYIDDDPAEFMA